jgi:hypothetical protein
MIAAVTNIDCSRTVLLEGINSDTIDLDNNTI